VTFQLTVGQRGDAPLGEQLLKDFKRGDVGTIIVDAAYDSDAIRKRARQIRAKVCIKPNSGRKKKKRYNRCIRQWERKALGGRISQRDVGSGVPVERGWRLMAGGGSSLFRLCCVLA